MVMDKTSIFAFPTPSFEYGAADGSAAALEFTSSMIAAEGAIIAAINTTSNAISLEIVNRTSADNILSNNISIVSAALAGIGDANIVSAQLASVSAVLQTALNTVSNAVSVVSQAVSVCNTAILIKAMNTGDQAAIQTSAMATISGLSLPLASGGNYFFKFLIPYTNDATTGIHIAVTGPTVTNFVAKTELPTAGTAQATTYSFATIATIGNKLSTVSNALSGVTLIAIVEGYINPSASTPSLHMTIGPTVNTASLVVRKGALGMAWKIS